MKRIFVALVCAVMMVGCTSPEEKMTDYLDQLCRAAMNDDDDEFMEIYYEAREWIDGLSSSSEAEADRAAEAWGESNIWGYMVIMQKASELGKKYEREHPKWYTTEQFVKYIKTTEPDLRTEEAGEYYTASWRHESVSAKVVYLNGDYYIDLGAYFPILVPFENAERAITWLNRTYSRLTDLRDDMKDAGVENIDKKITLDNPRIFYSADRSYRSSGPRYEIDKNPDFMYPRIEVDLDRSYYDYDGDNIEVKIGGNTLTISDKSYHAMIAALKCRNEMEKELSKYVKSENERERRKRELENSIF